MTNAELAILGLILERPRHGYAIEQEIEARGMRNWTEVGFSSIYYILKKLEQQGLIACSLEQQPGPARKVYNVTEAGRAGCLEATLQALSEPRPPSNRFLLGLAGLPAIPAGEALEALQRYKTGLVARRAGIEARWKGSGEELPLFLDGMFEYSFRLVETEIGWVEAFIRKLKRRKGKPERKSE